MTSPTSTVPQPEWGAPYTTPLPPRQLFWYLRFWHVVYLGVLAIILGNMLWQARTALGWRELAVTGLVAAQASLYLYSFVFNRRWPHPWWFLAGYFVISLALWYVEWRLEENFYWLIMTYFGQMFGMLPPWLAIPGTTLIYLFVDGRANGWDFSSRTPGQIAGTLFGWASFTVLYLFIYLVIRTSGERAHLIHRLQAAQREVAEARQHDSELAALRERERLARELHDSLGHALVAISVQLEAIQRLYRVDPEQAAGQLEALKGVARGSMDELRRALLGLRSPGLGDRPLTAALQALSLAVGQRGGIDVECRVDGPADQLSPALAETLWRAAQEALTNIERHAAARRVELRLNVQPHAVTLCVRDDGRGLSPGAEALSEHYGLRGMRERVEGLGGTLTLDGGPGTTVEVKLPIVRRRTEGE